MATVDQKFILLRHPMTAHDAEQVAAWVSQNEQMNFVFHERLGPVPAGDWLPQDGAHDFTEGTLEQLEYRRTLDYNREERREAKRQKRTLKHNEFKSVVPQGWRVLSPEDLEPTISTS
jgi:hypothetical protein